MEVVKGYSILKKRRVTHEKLVLTGYHSTAYGKKVKKEIARLGLKDDVILTGNIPYDQLPNLYHHAKLNIFASECENCPNILLEAMGSGRPLLASEKPPMPEFAKDAAIYFVPSSPKNLADKIISIIDNQDVLNKLSEKSTRKSVCYSWKNTALKTFQALEKLAAS